MPVNAQGMKMSHYSAFVNETCILP